MSEGRTCREAECERVSLEGAVFCGEHVGKKRRCKKTREVDGRVQRCKKPARIGLEVCEAHGGRFPQSAAQHERAVALTAMQRFIRPYEGDLNPISAFEMEFRRTLGRIEWYDTQLGLLKDEKDLIWGLTKHEKGVSGGGDKSDGIVNVKTYEARVNILVEMQWKERRHLLDMEKVWIAAGLEQQRLDQIKAFSHDIERILTRAFDILGLDLRDPEVIRALRIAYDEPQGDIIDVKAIERA